MFNEAKLALRKCHLSSKKKTREVVKAKRLISFRIKKFFYNVYNFWEGFNLEKRVHIAYTVFRKGAVKV